MSTPPNPDNLPELSPKGFAEMLMQNVPMTQEVHNFLVWWPEDKLYINLAIAPLYRTMIRNPVVIDVQLGSQKFVANLDRPVLLVPQDHPDCEQYGADAEELVIGTREDQSLITVTWYRRFQEPITAHAAYKIENGSLYKKVENQWQQVKLS